MRRKPRSASRAKKNPAEAGLSIGGDFLVLAVDAVISYNAIDGGGTVESPTADG